MDLIKNDIIRTLEIFVSPDTLERHSHPEVSDQATCFSYDQQKCDSGAERTVRLLGCCGMCEK